MKKAEKIAEAEAVLAEAERVGSNVRISDGGNFVVFTPPLDIDWSLRSIKVANQIKSLLLASSD